MPIQASCCNGTFPFVNLLVTESSHFWLKMNEMNEIGNSVTGISKTKHSWRGYSEYGNLHEFTCYGASFITLEREQ